MDAILGLKSAYGQENRNERFVSVGPRGGIGSACCLDVLQVDLRAPRQIDAFLAVERLFTVYVREKGSGTRRPPRFRVSP